MPSPDETPTDKIRRHAKDCDAQPRITSLEGRMVKAEAELSDGRVAFAEVKSEIKGLTTSVQELKGALNTAVYVVIGAVILAVLKLVLLDPTTAEPAPVIIHAPPTESIP